MKNDPTFSEDREITPEIERQVLDYYRVESRQASANREGYGAYYPETTGDERVDLRPGERVGDTLVGTERAGAERTGSERTGAATGDMGRGRPASPRRGATAGTARKRAVEPGSKRTTDEDEIRVRRGARNLSGAPVGPAH